jgi:hypothetical protein
MRLTEDVKSPIFDILIRSRRKIVIKLDIYRQSWQTSSPRDRKGLPRNRGWRCDAHCEVKNIGLGNGHDGSTHPAQRHERPCRTGEHICDNSRCDQQRLRHVDMKILRFSSESKSAWRGLPYIGEMRACRAEFRQRHQHRNIRKNPVSLLYLHIINCTMLSGSIQMLDRSDAFIAVENDDQCVDRSIVLDIEYGGQLI